MAMAQRRFKVYYGPETETVSTKVGNHQSTNSVTLPLGEVLPLLADAVRSNRTWLRDFEGDEITISTDLYEVILAYQHHLRPGA
jgi:hypothetical protein